MSIADKLTLLINTKQDIKSAISEKGVEVTGGMTTYADAIRRIGTGAGGGSISSIDIPVGLKFAYSTISELPQLNLGHGYEDGSYMFYNCQNLVSIGEIKSKEGSYLTNASNMFCECHKLKKLPKIDTRFVTDMRYMVRGCSFVNSEDFGEFSTSNAIYMDSMFEACIVLKNAPMMDTSNVQSMKKMFFGCPSLESIPKYNTSKVSNMDDLFRECRKLQSCPNLDSGNVTSMNNLFYDCLSLTSAPELNTQKVENTVNMFYKCESLVSVPLYDFGGVRVSGYEFYNCYKLENLGGFKNLKFPLKLSSSDRLTVESLMNVINNLYDFVGNGESTTRTLTLGTTNLNKLTAEQKAVATNKGWVLG